MAKPNAPKEIQPQTVKNENFSMKRVVTINLVTTLVICAIVFVANFITTQKLSNKIDRISVSNEQTEDLANEAEHGVIVDMGEFTMNLADAHARRYLKVSVALELSKSVEEINSAAKGIDVTTGHELEYEMNQFKPAIKDSIISILSSKTSDELATIPGKETAKEQIAEAVEAIFNGEREVMRVSFGQFIMQ